MFSFADPSASVDAVNGLTVELRIETRTIGVFSAVLLDEGGEAAAAGVPAKRKSAA